MSPLCWSNAWYVVIGLAQMVIALWERLWAFKRFMSSSDPISNLRSCPFVALLKVPAYGNVLLLPFFSKPLSLPV